MKSVTSAAIVAAAIVAASAALLPHEPTNLYPSTGRVLLVNRTTDTVVATDAAGHQWAWTGAEDYYPGDLVSLLMSDAGTPDWIYDDVVESARYAGDL